MSIIIAGDFSEHNSPRIFYVDFSRRPCETLLLLKIDTGNTVLPQMSNTPSNHSSNFVPRLLEALEASGKTRTHFGYVHFGDPAFLKRAEAGVNFHKSTIAKMDAVFDLYKIGTKS